ncbi:aminoglycoside phosphotransferase [Planomonospora sp. ID82291]|uniref:aminoglycoside phosphotransferase n=1 Tax=Planomonospora sp. ID82291 TaxID=2738136 RepID=UPI0018C3D778|nr:aminoglycoside phosphotransferase [Planomonospora sp. ID82291]MBG0818406.1 aminoglycoside phosphotransferase [Planomonospora sp. ID82291]
MADDHRRMRRAFARAAVCFACVLAGDTVAGWRGRAVSGRVERAGVARWLRVVAAAADQAETRLWRGVEAAQAITGVARPELLDVCEWFDHRLRWRAELSTFVTARSVSAAPELRAPVRLASAWWRELRVSLAAVAATRTDRVAIREDLVGRRLEWISGGALTSNVTAWECGHADVHWANLTAPGCVLLDWEGWGMQPAGTDAAMLRAYSLLRPEVADEVAAVFADELTGSHGRQVQVFAAAELLVAAGRGDHPDLVDPLLAWAAGLLGEPAGVIARRLADTGWEGRQGI